MTTRQPSGGSTLERALLALEKMEAKLAAVERAKAEPLALVGMACRFPGGATTPGLLWQRARAGVDCVTEIPPERWSSGARLPHPAARWGGLLENVDQFDAPFFGIGRAEAADMDPQQRLLLEVSWEALEDAAVPPTQLSGSKTAVFMGVSSAEYLELITPTLTEPHPYVPAGNARSFIAGRIAHSLGTQGPCATIETACASSLVALHFACQSLRRGECDLALAGGVNLLLSPELTSLLATLQILSPDGRCRTFDASANGYARAEGVGVVVLRRLSDAERRGDRILALVRGSAMNHNGRAASPTAPNLKAQAAVIRAACQDARVAPERVGYVEVHSNGSPLGDPVELEALKETVGKPRADGATCVLGSVKTLIGHAEAASGMASLVKAVLVLQQETIPPNLHFQSLTPHVSLDDTCLVIPTAEIPWKRGDLPRLAGISSTGLSGTNVHVIIEEPPRAPRVEAASERPAHLFVLSGKTSEALRDRAKQMLRHLPAHPEQPLGDVCHTLGAGRSHFEFRFAAIVASRADASAALADFVEGAPGAYVAGRVEGGAARRRIAFVFSGHASQARGALSSLDAAPPALREALQRGDDAARALLGRSILPIVTGEAIDPPPDGAVDHEIALFVLQYALVEMWQAWGIEPSVVIGEGTGECVATWVSGMLPLGDAMALALARAELISSGARDASALAQVLAKAKPTSPRRAVIPSLGGDAQASSLLTKAYWERQAKEARPLATILAASSLQGNVTLVEIGPGQTRTERAPLVATASAMLPSLAPGVPPLRSLLDGLGSLYVRGSDPQWEAFDAPHAYRSAPLPSYPFQRQRYWFDAASAPSQEPSVPEGHPLLGHALPARADRPEVRAWEIGLGPSARANIGIQRLVGGSWLSSGGLVAMASAAARETFGDAPLELSLSLGDPPALRDEDAATMQIIATPDGDRKATIGLFFRDRSHSPWKRVAQGSFSLVEPSDDDEELAPPSMRPGRRQSVPAALWTHRLELLGVEPAAFAIDQLWRREGETLARGVVGKNRADIFVRAVAAITSITHPAAHGRPWMVESVEGLTRTSTSAEGRAWLRVNWDAYDVWSARVSAELVSEDGDVLASARRIALRAQDPASALRAQNEDPLGGAFIDLVWREIPPPVGRVAARRAWILLTDTGGVGQALAAQLKAAGDAVITLPAARLEQQIAELDLALAVGASFHGIVHLGALDAPSNDALSPGSLEDALREGPLSALRVIDRLSFRAHVPRLWLVTRGAQAVGDEAPAIAQAGLWGLGRTLSLERPDMWGGLIDLDPSASADETTELCKTLTAQSSEEYVALRGARRYMARLSRAALPVHRPLEVRPDRTYLVTGACTTLGEELARWLVQRGARSLLLPIESGQTPGEWVQALEAQGARVFVDSPDPADMEAMRVFLSRAPHALGGIFDAASFQDGHLHRLTSRDTADALRASFRSKCVALWVLHTLTAAASLDFFVTFSSAASALGWEGLGIDAFAAECVGALARNRRCAGQRAAAVRVASPIDARPLRTDLEHEMVAAGLQGMPASMVLLASELAVAEGAGVTTVAWIDWDLFEQSHRARAGRSLFEGLGASSGAKAGAPQLRRRVAAADPQQASRLIEGVVRNEVARVVGRNQADLPASTQDLSTLGMDSIMGIQVLTNVSAAFGVNLPVSALLENTTMGSLAARVARMLRPDEPSSAEDPASISPLSRRGLLVELAPKGAKPPFFCAPPLTGAALIFQALVQHMGEDQPFHSFNAPGLDTDAPPCDRVEALADHFIQAMRQVAPRGPYRLGGYSFGAFVAYEMAQVLTRAGERVDLLVLVDPPAPRTPSGTARLLDMARMFELSLDEPSFRALSRDEQIASMASSVGERLMLPPELGESSRQLRLYRAHLDALIDYEPPAYEGALTVLRARDTAVWAARNGLFSGDPTFGWGALCSGHVRSYEVPGHHFSLLVEPAARETAGVLRQVLEELNLG
ncbi:type I polyketide synthase [Polyangium sp. 6x1]|uniref:type I polyketide synthase n=1 Tax=Polyangium sp. 6x1 TaxID=3042689 RepID=UPI002482C812|nr:type I polyketide synthase [Polyangium sp. 6x1]MDI1443202.1 beta-ketoacyl synthase N-terminal-like domain-containing protein [Polyangium sp. 6x1]